MKQIFLILVCLISYIAKSQLPETRIYLIDINRDFKGYHFSAPRIISKAKGYNNQPFFTPDEKYILFASSVDTVNTEIFRYDLKKKKSKRITHTPEQEFSPRYTADDENLSCVRVEKDRTTQHFVSMNKKGKKSQVIQNERKLIGYYEWLNVNEYLAFDLPEPFYLTRHHLINGKSDTLAQNIGRTFFFLRTKNKIVYLDKSDSLHWVIRTVAAENLRRVRKKANIENPVLTDIFEGEEDFCFMRDGSILMGHEGVLYYKKNPFNHPKATWEKMIDLKSYGIEKFTRISISPDNGQLAIVAAKK